jgi:diadenosine tetraphosphate (Ap4A) HIT family hydrolase
MEISEEEFKEIKEKLISYINNNFPEDKKSSSLDKLDSMNKEELASFLEKNNILFEEEQCVFCLIGSKKIPSCILEENEENLAVLDINPLSEGNSLIIPKSHGKVKESTLLLAQKIKEGIEKNLMPLEVKVEKQSMFNHELINLIPIYKDKELKKEKKSIEELEIIKEKILKKDNQEGLNKKEETLNNVEEQEAEEKNLWLPKRIP